MWSLCFRHCQFDLTVDSHIHTPALRHAGNRLTVDLSFGCIWCGCGSGGRTLSPEKWERKKMSKVTKGCHVLDFQKSNHVRIARAYTDRCVIPSLAAGEFVLWCLLTARTPLLCCSEEAEIQTLRFPGSFSSTAQEQVATPRCWSWSC